MFRLTFASFWRVSAIAAAAAFFLSGCSPEVGFPAVHDMPPPRADTTLTPDEVKQATDNLLSARDKLSTEAQTAAPASTGLLPAPAANAPAARASGAGQSTGAAANKQ